MELRPRLAVPRVEPERIRVTAESWQRVKQILEDTLEVPREARDSYLQHACGDDLELRNEVESLLHSYDDAGGFIDTPALAITELIPPAPFPGESNGFAQGSCIGPYRIVQTLGEGGMGVVYQAVRSDDLYRKLVAIKVIRLSIASRSFIARFENERQILAHFDHPFIAKLIDGGTTDDGRPYFVMDFIAGLPIDEYCDRNQLPIVDRLRLFLEVCSAVTYAHNNLVVHRDLKPQNILVTQDGSPRLLDFGIAKMIDDESAAARTNPTLPAPMTPDYASPEQVQGGVITTASDTYSLGVLLYEMLTGYRPYVLKSSRLEEMAGIIVEHAPTRPSNAAKLSGRTQAGEGQAVDPEVASAARSTKPEKLRRQLCGDLDNIVLLALRKEPERRYGSVEQFAADIRRHLDGQPVQARKDTVFYRTSKFVRRNAASVMAATLLVLSLAAGLITTSWQARVARNQRALAENRFRETRRLANSVLFELHDAIETLPGSTRARSLLVERAREYLDALATPDNADLSLDRERALAYQRIGDVLGRPSAPNLGMTTEARKSYAKALAIEQSLARKQPDEPQFRRDLATIELRICSLEQSVGDFRTALASGQQAVRTLEKLVKNPDAAPEVRNELAYSYQISGGALADLGMWAQANDYHRKALTLAAALNRANPVDEYRVSLGYAWLRLAHFQHKTKDFAAAARSAREAVPHFEYILHEHPDDTSANGNLALALQRLGDALVALGEFGSALTVTERALFIRERLLKSDPSDVRAKLNLAYTHGSIGTAFFGMGRVEVATQHFLTQRELTQQLVDINSDRIEYQTNLSQSWESLGGIYLRKRQCERARGALGQALAIYARLQARRAITAEYAGVPERIRLELSACRARVAAPTQF